MPVDVIVVGAGGFGRELLDVIEAHNAAIQSGRAYAPGEFIRVRGVADDALSDLNRSRLTQRGYAHLGNLETAIRELSPAGYLIGVGSTEAKIRIAAQLDAAGWTAATVIHPDAVVGSVAGISAGSVICGGVQLSTNTRLGRHVHLNPNATVGHDTVLDDFVSVNPAATISGEVRIGMGTLVGAGSVVLQGLTVGERSTIGASACVTRDVVAESTMVGIPAKQLIRKGVASMRRLNHDSFADV